MKQRVAFTLRPWNKNDVDSLVRYANNWHIAKNMTDHFPYPYAECDGLAFIDFAVAASLARLFAIAIDEGADGGIGLHAQTDIHRKNVELGY